MSGSFKGKNPLMWGLGNPANFAGDTNMPPVPNAAKREDAKVEAAAAAEADRIRKKRGWMSTWLTGPQGMGGQTGGLKTKLGE